MTMLSSSVEGFTFIIQNATGTQTYLSQRINATGTRYLDISSIKDEQCLFKIQATVLRGSGAHGNENYICNTLKAIA